MKTIDIRHKINFHKGDTRGSILIKLNDECHNGNADFSITMDAQEKFKGRWRDSFGGCCHDFILKIHPELKIFVDLDLSDSNGAPMHAVANGYFHAWNMEKSEADRQKIIMKYLRCTQKEYKELTKAKDKKYFQYTIERLGLPARWKEEVQKAIAELEKLSGKTWDAGYDWKRSNYVFLTQEEKREIEEKIASGYYSTKAMKKREYLQRKKVLQKKITYIKEEARKESKDILKNAKVEIWAIKKIENLKKKNKTFIVDYDNVIYYSHTNELNFNWRGNYPQVTKENYILFCSHVTEQDLKLLPKNIKITFSQNLQKLLIWDSRTKKYM